MNRLLTILGPTACGKTTFAAQFAYEMNGEILSADSRQVYRGMDIGTGKDLADYLVDSKPIPYHLIDIADAGYKYNVYEFQRDFMEAYKGIVARGAVPIMCGGTGLYLESILRSYRLSTVPQNPELRQSLSAKSLDELTEILMRYKKLHNKTDVDTAQRAIRAIEIEEYYKKTAASDREFPEIKSLVIGLELDRDLRREKISKRLKTRLDEGMVDEIRRILDSGVSAEDLLYYGLEYKFVTLYVTGKLSYEDMVGQLEIAIHQFAKRQMTWFRGMERRGVKINWLNCSVSMNEKIEKVRRMWENFE